MISDALHKTKSQMVYEILLDKVNRGELQPGYKYTAKELAEQMSISRTPVNEAVKRLAEQGHITMMPKAGFTVNKIYWEDIEEIAQIINYIERMIFHRILQRGNNLKLERMIVLCDAMSLAVESENSEAYFNAFWKLHETMYTLAKIKLARDIFKRYWNYNEWYNVSTPERKTIMLELCKDYLRVVCALEQHDAREVDRIMEQHLEQMLRFLKMCFGDIAT